MKEGITLVKTELDTIASDFAHADINEVGQCIVENFKGTSMFAPMKDALLMGCTNEGKFTAECIEANIHYYLHPDDYEIVTTTDPDSSAAGLATFMAFALG